MCLGVPGRILEIDGNAALCDFWGVKKVILLDAIDEPVVPGDFILNHVGYAIRRIPPQDIADTLALYDELLRLAHADDLMAADVRAEIAGGRKG